MTASLRRFGVGMGAWVTGCVIVAGALLVWDAATRLWFFDGLFRLDIQAAQHPGFGSGVVRAVLHLFLGSPAWPIWAATVGASVAVLASSKLTGYRVPLLFGVGFGPALTTILEGGSPVSGKPLGVLIPVWLLVIVADIFLTWGLAWCILALPERAKMARQGTEELRSKGGFPVIGRAAGFALIFAGGQSCVNDLVGEWLPGMQEVCQRIARFDRAKAQREFSRAIWRMVPWVLWQQLSRHGWSRFLVEPMER